MNFTDDLQKKENVEKKKLEYDKEKGVKTK